MMSKMLLSAVPPISSDRWMMILRIGLLTALLLSSLLLTGTASAQPIPGLCGG